VNTGSKGLTVEISTSGIAIVGMLRGYSRQRSTIGLFSATVGLCSAVHFCNPTCWWRFCCAESVGVSASVVMMRIARTATIRFWTQICSGVNVW